MARQEIGLRAGNMQDAAEDAGKTIKESLECLCKLLLVLPFNTVLRHVEQEFR